MCRRFVQYADHDYENGWFNSVVQRSQNQKWLQQLPEYLHLREGKSTGFSPTQSVGMASARM